MSCGAGRRHGLNPMLLWLWHRPVAIAPIRHLAWEPPYAARAAQRNSKKTKNKKTKKNKEREMLNMANYKRNSDQNHNEVTPHTSQNDHHQKVYKQLLHLEWINNEVLL